VHTAAKERALNAHTRAVTAPREAAVASPTPQDVGEWGQVVNWRSSVCTSRPCRAARSAYDSVGDNATETYPVHDHTRATVWDPATGTQTPVNVDTGFNIFCSGLAHLADGRMFMAGGNKDSALNGIVQTHLFDPGTNLWSLGPNMLGGRWYPTVSTTEQRRDAITSGRVNTPEVRTLAGGSACAHTASLSLPLYPWMDVAPDGLPSFRSRPECACSTRPAPARGDAGQRDGIYRDYGGHTLFDVGKLLVAGGGTSTSDARVVDLNGPTPQVSTTAPMAYGRRQHNLTVLADGTVLATGGNSSGAGLVDLDAGVYRPSSGTATGQWRTWPRCRSRASTTRRRCCCRRASSPPAAGSRHLRRRRLSRQNAEVFSPPYLFDADGTLAERPTIDAAPTAELRAAMEIATGNQRRSAKSLLSGSAPSRTQQHGAAVHPLSFSRRDQHRATARLTPTSRRRASCFSSSTRTACLPLPAW
jgi:hypothetical protein